MHFTTIAAIFGLVAGTIAAPQGGPPNGLSPFNGGFKPSFNEDSSACFCCGVPQSPGFTGGDCVFLEGDGSAGCPGTGGTGLAALLVCCNFNDRGFEDQDPVSVHLQTLNMT